MSEKKVFPQPFRFIPTHPYQNYIYQGLAVSPNRLAMSRALGAAFLNHQVEQLEKSVTVANSGHGMGLAPGSGSWRNRRPLPPGASGGGSSTQPAGMVKRPPMAPGIKVASKGGNTKDESQAARKARVAAAANGGGVAAAARREGHSPANVKVNAVVGRKSMDGEREADKDKEADIIVVDASVLVHALYQVKKWCRDGRAEILIVPLEGVGFPCLFSAVYSLSLLSHAALNTLDLLKKGTTPLAQRARAASRILEAQVGTNPRIRVQQDDAFVLWEKITFDSDNHHSESPVSSANKPTNALASPEWVRRTICCAKWEVDNVTATVGVTAPNAATTIPAPTTAPTPAAGPKTRAKPPPTVALAVLSTATGIDVSPRNPTLKLSESPPESQSLLLNPVPLPGPPHPHAMSHGHGHGPGGNKFEPRVTGTLVARWAGKAGIKLLEVEPTRFGGGVGGVVSEDEGRGGGRTRGGHVGRARRGSYTDGSGGGLGVAGGVGGGGGVMGAGLVERPPAVRAMMEMVAQQPANTRVVRVLARGEKLDPDP